MPTQQNNANPDLRTFKDLTLVGGHTALDFLNTVKYRGEIDPQDKLESMSDVLHWTAIAGVLSGREISLLEPMIGFSGKDTRLLNQIRSFRESVRLLFDETDKQSAEYIHAITLVEQAVSKLQLTATINKTTGVLVQHIVVSSPPDILSRIVSCVAELMTQRDNFTIKICNGSDCDWLFIDKTKARRRCWCDTRTCGNLARVRNFRSKRGN